MELPSQATSNTHVKHPADMALIPPKSDWVKKMHAHPRLDDITVVPDNPSMLGLGIEKPDAQQPATSSIDENNVEVISGCFGGKTMMQKRATPATSKSTPENPFALSDSIVEKMNTQKPATFSYARDPFDVHDGLDKIHIQQPPAYDYLKGSAEGPFSLSDGTKLIRQRPLNLRLDRSPVMAVLVLVALAAWFVAVFVLLRYVKRTRKIDLVKPELEREVELSNMRWNAANPASRYRDEGDETPESMV